MVGKSTAQGSTTEGSIVLSVMDQLERLETLEESPQTRLFMFVTLRENVRRIFIPRDPVRSFFAPSLRVKARKILEDRGNIRVPKKNIPCIFRWCAATFNSPLKNVLLSLYEQGEQGKREFAGAPTIFYCSSLLHQPTLSVHDFSSLCRVL